MITFLIAWWLRETIWKVILIVQQETVRGEFEKGMDFGNNWEIKIDKFWCLLACGEEARMIPTY